MRSCAVWTCIVGAVAFDIDAHDAIGQTSASGMDQRAIKQLKRLMGGKDASDVAGWGHQVDDTFPGFAKLHFQEHDDGAEFCASKADLRAKCEGNVCLVQALKHFYGRILSDEAQKMEYPAIDYSSIAKGIKVTDADALKMLINLLGDLHQPLHLGYSGDDMGRKVRVIFRNKEISLYEFWDSTISETVRNEESNFWLGGWTHVHRIQDDFEADKAKWAKLGAFKMFDEWAQESVTFACKKAYMLPGGKMLAGPNAVQGPTIIDDAAYRELRAAFLRQILLAGERTAIVLNDILENKGASKLTLGSGLKTKADEEEEKQKADIAVERKATEWKEWRKRAMSRYTYGPFFTNLSIAVIVVPIFLIINQFGIRPRTYIALWENFRPEDGGASQVVKRFD
mmetsp:Transcript_42561/g.112310  ORF Transcript_42561/g.112310 Transcript_42561/m.112310 type:complete len:397 (-) Transcript_42561:43-1233(-)